MLLYARGWASEYSALGLLTLNSHLPRLVRIMYNLQVMMALQSRDHDLGTWQDVSSFQIRDLLLSSDHQALALK